MWKEILQHRIFRVPKFQVIIWIEWKVGEAKGIEMRNIWRMRDTQITIRIRSYWKWVHFRCYPIQYYVNFAILLEMFPQKGVQKVISKRFVFWGRRFDRKTFSTFIRSKQINIVVGSCAHFFLSLSKTTIYTHKMWI